MLKRRRFNQLLGASMAGGAFGLGPMVSGCQENAGDRNLLMICIDDLNDYPAFMGGYKGLAHTPNLDAFAASGRVFSNAHACVPVCMPSRVSVLFGKSPDATKIYGHGGAYSNPPGPRSDFGRYNALLSSPEVLSLPQIVKKYVGPDYVTHSMGKVFHSAEPDQWDVAPPFVGLSTIYSSYPVGPDRFDYGIQREGETHQDQVSADWACELLSRTQSRPMFIGLGFYQPHPPWRLPRWAFDLYPDEALRLPEYRPEDLDDVPETARKLARLPLIDGEKSNFELVRELGTHRAILQAYLAAMSHTDQMLGQVLDCLDAGPHANNTDVVLWSDHGYHLGEKLHLRKATLWEKSTRVPLVIRSSVTKPNETVNSAVSLLDLAPTMIDLLGGDVEAAIQDCDLSGHSLLSGPRSPAITHWAGARSLRTDHWRYTAYKNGEEELYNHLTDPDEYENLAGLAQYSTELEELRATLGAAG